jgi:hypothetical protein
MRDAHDLDDDLETFRDGARDLAQGRAPADGFNAVCDRLYGYANPRKLSVHPLLSDIAQLKREMNPMARPKMLANLVYDFQVMNVYRRR